jgi:NADH-quinone oxidoreductase subunit N
VLYDFVNSISDDTLRSIQLFKPELGLCVAVVLLLLVRVFFKPRSWDATLIALVGCGYGLYHSLPWNMDAMMKVAGDGTSVARVEIFSGLLVYDQLTIYLRAFLLLFAILAIILSRLTGIPDHDDSPDFFVLLLGSTLGMCVMASANHMLTIFMGVEMASVPSYAMAGLLKGRRKSSEAAIKYAVYGAGAAGIMLYGISLLSGLTGSAHVPTIAKNLAAMGADGGFGQSTFVLILAGLMIAAGLAFKLSAVPFHFWCPDVFEGASAEVNAFLSIASKAAALALLLRVTIGLGYGTEPAQTRPIATASTPVATSTEEGVTIQRPTFEIVPVNSYLGVPVGVTKLDGDIASDRVKALAPVRSFMIWVIGIGAIVSCTFGNLAAYGQTNIKRMLAYSTIAHAGYMMMPVAAGLALIEVNKELAQQAFSSIPFYLGMYLFMNLTAFSIIAFLRNTMRSENYPDYAGMIQVSPGVTVCLAMALFSLIGLPPFAGFAGKYTIFAGVTQAALVAPEKYQFLMWTILVIGGLNTAISLYYYLRVIKTMTLDPLPKDRPVTPFSLLSIRGIYVAVVAIPLLILGIFFSSFLELARHVTEQLLS